MQSRRAPRAAVMVAMAMFLMSCEPAGTVVGGNRADDYQVARQALETGNYSLAISRYERLLTQAGDAAGRLQLEYAHSLLRGARYEDASPSRQRWLIRIAAACRATRWPSAAPPSTRSSGPNSLGREEPELRSRLVAAQSDLNNFVKNHAKLDAAGAMKARLQMIAADLKEVG